MTGNEIRALSLRAVHRAGKGHIGGVLSCADILAALYSGVMRDIDRFILSKGHVAVGLYAALALAGKISEAEVLTLNQEGQLGEHPHRGIPGVEINAGSLGHGLSIACGMALAGKLRHSGGRLYVLLGDGECWEGSVWEAAMFGAHHGLNITAILDANGFSVQGATKEIMSLGDLAAKWNAFGWNAYDCDGHNMDALLNCLPQDGPQCVIARTVKGKGVSFMEGAAKWHHGSLSDAQIAQALGELHGHA